MRTSAFADDPAVLLSFHYYDPYQFTHQGAPWNDARHLADVPYPALARPLTENLAATAAAIAKTGLTQPQKILAYRDAQSRLDDYRRSGFDRGTIDRAFDRVADWARAQGVPPGRVLLGEFGARETELQAFGSRTAEHAQWLRDVRQAAEAHGFRWAVWTYRDTGGFALVSSDTSNEIKPTLVDALGLEVGSARRTASGPSERSVRGEAMTNQHRIAAPPWHRESEMLEVPSPTVSILIKALNEERHIAAAIESALAALVEDRAARSFWPTAPRTTAPIEIAADDIRSRSCQLSNVEEQVLRRRAFSSAISTAADATFVLIDGDMRAA